LPVKVQGALTELRRFQNRKLKATIQVIENGTISIQNPDDNSIQRYEGAIIIENFCLAKQDSNGAKSGLLHPDFNPDLMHWNV
jgi:hypothetical protein